MSPQTWNSGGEMPLPPPGLFGWALAVVRGVPLALVVFGGLALMIVLRLFERPLFGQARPVTPWITQAVCRTAFWLMGIGYATRGKLLTGRGAVVSNHVSWMDIFALNARKRVYFVSKAEVASWPGIGWLARATGTIFINRRAVEARQQAEVFRERLAVGHRLLFFPEGTSTDGQRVLPFKSSLFSAFLCETLRDSLCVQPVTLRYVAPPGKDPRHYGWWGEMGFGQHLLHVLATYPQGRVEIVYHTPLRISEFSDRKALARACEDAVRSAL